MYVPHILVALGLSAAAAIAFTGAALTPIGTGRKADCTVAGQGAGKAACELAGGVSVPAQSSRSPDEEPDHRHERRYRRPYPDCHRDERRHFVPGYGVILHVHIGPDCTVRRVTHSSGG